ncbi:homocysteine S-methyltransferase [Clavibacter michiganensis]|uniref:Homocysteine S-methyltransferase n=1 Tax=Clavibacter michiganensis TaxID=28447 RepID=A0A2S5VX60_9MICO|nr:homocysteine S-methyltransferase [Clavibacter michiganensis]PPF70603.1 homocysteine S-methyltransferase [Clavibacter michiganensis]
MARPLPLPDRPLVLDGGLGTLLEARGHDLTDPLWSARVLADEPDAIRSAHAEYFRAGADVAITASYQVGFEAFARRGLDGAATEGLLRASVRLAAEARDGAAREDAVGDAAAGRPAGAPRDRWIAASVGPYGATLGDGSEYRGSSGLTGDELRRWHAPRFAVLADAGADLLACETIPSLDEGRALVDLARGSGARVWLAFTVADGRLRSGQPMGEGFALAEEADEVVAVGINCAHPDEVPGAIAAARAATDRPVVVYPNSGERWDAVARGWVGDPALPSVDAWIAAGASLVGGCCRVGPAEVRRMRDALG